MTCLVGLACRPELVDILKVVQMDKSGQLWGAHLEDQDLKVVHGIVWVDRLHLLLPPEAHIELPAKRKVHLMEIQKEDVNRIEMMEDGRYV